MTRSNKRNMLVALLLLPLAVAGLAYGQSFIRAEQPQSDTGYICPLTGEELPCPACCPLGEK